ncbi:MAG: altronate dehydratase [Bacteroidales bacterium]|nr:altronate dehydratase [Bacteroidales bacterium]
MDFLQIHPSDNVAVALRDLAEGTEIVISSAASSVISSAAEKSLTLRAPIPAGHKFTLRDLAGGEDVIKYGYPIGHLTRAAAAGILVDHSCIKTNLSGLLEYTYNPVEISPRDTSCLGRDDKTVISSAASSVISSAAEKSPSFKGFRRSDGQVGVRNEIWIIPTVGCVNGICQQLAEEFRREIGFAAASSVIPSGSEGISSVDAVVAFPHNYGCSQLGDDHENTRTILADMVHHPNAGGVLVVGLGCENNQLEAFREKVGPMDERRVKMFVTQKVEDEIGYGLKCLREIYEMVSKDVREEVPVSELRVGLKCGGSDGLSGITANPLLGRFSDWLVARGGTTVLTEVPEMFGAETILMNRCRDEATFDKTVHLINDFKEYFIKQGQPVYENPSPGNKAGGISTLEEKSLGCTQKCGTSAVIDVLRYGEMLKEKGLSLLSAPGNDLVASTALASAGCQIVLFTTGRGTPFGSFVPTMKISTNTPLYEKKPGWIDFNAGVIAEDTPMDECTAKFIDYVLRVASGEPVNNEKNGYREIAIFKTGVTL